MPERTRLHRSELAVPGSNMRMLEQLEQIEARQAGAPLREAVPASRA
jgi:hypothetical protein